MCRVIVAFTQGFEMRPTCTRDSSSSVSYNPSLSDTPITGGGVEAAVIVPVSVVILLLLIVVAVVGTIILRRKKQHAG